MFKLAPGFVISGLLLSLTSACTTETAAVTPSAASLEQAIANRAGITAIAATELPELQVGQVIYVPVYSEVYDFDQNRTFQLTATLSLRNTDMSNPIVVETIDYYNSDGEKINSYLEQPIELAPLASFEVVVAKDDQSGGAGANFIVEWRAAGAVTEPITEAIMISTISQQGMSFVSAGRVIQERSAETPTQ